MTDRIEDQLKEKFPDMPTEQIDFVVKKVKEKQGFVYDTLDKSIEGVLGEQKPPGKQTIEWLSEKLGGYKSKAETVEQMLKGDIEAQKAKNAELEKLLKEGKIDGAAKGRIEELEKALNDERGKLKSLEDQRTKEKEDWQKNIDEEKANNYKYRVESLFDSAISSVTKKDENLVSKTLQEIAIKEAKERGFSQKGEFVKDPITSKESFVFRDDENKILMSKDSPGQPMGVLEFLRSNGLSEIEDPGRKQNGTGTAPLKGKSGNGSFSVDVNGAKSLVEADEAFTNAWFAQGKTKSDPEYNTKWQEMRKSLPADLPMQ